MLIDHLQKDDQAIAEPLKESYRFQSTPTLGIRCKISKYVMVKLRHYQSHAYLDRHTY